jgi:putative transposase
VIDEHLGDLEAVTSTKQACALLGASRATIYRRRHPEVARPPVERPEPANKLSEQERQAILTVLRPRSRAGVGPLAR